MKKIYVVAKALVKFENKYLMIKRSKEDDIGAGTWEFPGGKLEFNESIEECILREIKEETNLDAEIIRLAYVTDFFTSPEGKVLLVNYLCKSKSGDVTISDEHSDYKWVVKEDILRCISSNIAESLIQYKVIESL